MTKIYYFIILFTIIILILTRNNLTKGNNSRYIPSRLKYKLI